MLCACMHVRMQANKTTSALKHRGVYYTQQISRTCTRKAPMHHALGGRTHVVLIVDVERVLEQLIVDVVCRRKLNQLNLCDFAVPVCVHQLEQGLGKLGLHGVQYQRARARAHTHTHTHTARE